MNNMKRKLAKVGMAAVSAVMTEAEVRRDGAKAFRIALGAMRGVVESLRPERPSA